MPQDIDILIDFYQWEIKRVQSQIDENLKLQCYEEIEWDFPRLRYLKRELEALLILKDKNYLKKKRIVDRIQFFQKKVDENPEAYPYFNPLIKENKKQLYLLKDIHFDSNLNETQLIDEHLSNILSNKIKAFKIHLNFKSKLYIRVSLSKDEKNFTFLIHHGNHDYDWYKKYSLINDLGYKETQNKGLQLFAPIKINKNILEIKELLSRSVISFYEELGEQNKAYIELIK